MCKSIVTVARRVMKAITQQYHHMGIALFGVYLSLMTNTVFAEGEDILLEPTQNLFATFVGTGCNGLLMMEFCAACYYLTTQRKMTALVLLPTMMALTTWAKIKFGG